MEKTFQDKQTEEMKIYHLGMVEKENTSKNILNDFQSIISQQ